MIELGAVETAMPPTLKAARGLWLILEAAELRGLPMPFSARATDHSPVELQFHTRAEVYTWAAALDVAEVVDDSHTEGVNDTTTAAAEWFDVPLTLVASVPRMPRSGGVA